MKYNRQLQLQLQRDLPRYRWVRLYRNSWLVHLWSPASPQTTACGYRITARTVAARAGSGSVCHLCERYLEDLNFTWPGSAQGQPERKVVTRESTEPAPERRLRSGHQETLPL